MASIIPFNLKNVNACIYPARARLRSTHASVENRGEPWRIVKNETAAAATAAARRKRDA